MKVQIAAIALLVGVAPNMWAADAQEECGLRTAVSERRAEVRERNAQLNQVGIQERNSAVVTASPTISKGACMDQIYAVMDNITDNMSSSFGSVFTRQLTSQLGKMGCAEADKFYREIMRTELGKFDDQLGMIGSVGDITGYHPNRTTTVDVRKAIEIGREIGSGVSAPMRPPGRGGVSNGEERAISGGVRDALKNL